LASKKEQKEEARRLREEREAEERKKQRRKRRIWQIASAFVVVVAIIVIAVVVSSSGGNDTNATKKEGAKVTDRFQGIAQNGIELGNKQAKVTLYEFADLQCPFCRQYTLGPFHQLVDKYVRSGKVKMVFRNLTFIGGDSVTAARAAAAAGAQNRLWNFIDLFYENQGQENTGYVTDKFISDIATNAGIDVAKLNNDVSAPFVEQELSTAQNEAQQFGINSTPSFLLQVGKQKPQKLNYQNFDLSSFTGPIDAALKQAGSGP
jgi:protein-disulfide isomerase